MNGAYAGDGLTFVFISPDHLKPVQTLSKSKAVT